MKQRYWIAQYSDGKSDYEQIGHKFQNIDKKRLSSIISKDDSSICICDINTGEFIVDGRLIKIKFIYNDKAYKITNRNKRYEDILQYKEAYTDLDYTGKISKQTITSYNIGWEDKINIEDKILDFYVILSIKENHKIIEINSNEIENGYFQITIDNTIIDKYEKIGNKIFFKI